MKRSGGVVTASETASRAWCPESWRLESHWAEPSNQADLALGETHHARKAAFEERRTTQLPEQRVASVSDVPEGQSLNFSYPEGDYPAILVHLPGGEFVAYEQRCTHLLCPVLYDGGKNERLFPIPEIGTFVGYVHFKTGRG